MTKQSRNSGNIISAHDIDSDFEYNFDLNPFNYLLEGILLFITVPFKIVVGLTKKASARLRKIQQEQAYRQTFKGPACMLK